MALRRPIPLRAGELRDAVQDGPAGWRATGPRPAVPLRTQARFPSGCVLVRFGQAEGARLRLKPLISILMPVHETPEEWLTAAIESVRGSYEVIVVGNGRERRTLDELASLDACVEVGGFDESFILCGSDVELCRRARARGLRNVMPPHARLLHHEAKRRGSEIPRSDFQRSFAAYEPYLRDGDPYYNPNLSLKDPAVALREGPEDMLEFARSFL